MINHSTTQSIKLNNLLDKIHLFLRNFNSYNFFHVLRDLNGMADKEANKGALLEAGVLTVNEMIDRVELP